MFRWGTDFEGIEKLVFDYLVDRPYQESTMIDIKDYLKTQGYDFSSQQVGAITKALEEKGRVSKRKAHAYGKVYVEVAERFKII